MKGFDPAVMKPGSRVLDRRERRGQWVAIAILSAPLILGSLIDATKERASWLGIEGPECPSRLISSVGCPGCGLTRSVALTMHGHFADAWQVSPAGIFVVLLAAVGLFVRGDILFSGRIGTFHETLLRRGRQVFLLALLVSWVGRGIMHGEVSCY